jgi:hypothetical protein
MQERDKNTRCYSNPPKFLFITQRKILKQILAPKPSRAKEWIQDGKGERDIW